MRSKIQFSSNLRRAVVTGVAAITLTFASFVGGAQSANATSPCNVGNTYTTWASLKTAAAATGSSTVCVGANIQVGSGGVTADALTIGGNVVLDLNGFSLTIVAPTRTAAVIVASGTSLAIQDSAGLGVLNATGNQAAGVGATRGGSLGSITINSGTINATGGASSAAIGSASALAGTVNISITGGTINATGGSAGAAIGVGQQGVFTGQIAISGGTINAVSDTSVIGTGHASNAAGMTILISGGIINATSTSGRAAIGTSSGSIGDITISGGTVTANGVIGASGSGGTAAAITISGGNVSATSSTWAIGAMLNANAVVNGPILISGGTVKARSTSPGWPALGPDSNNVNTSVTGGQVETNNGVFTASNASVVGPPASAFQAGSQSWTLLDGNSANLIGFQPADVLVLPSTSTLITISETPALNYLIQYLPNGGSGGLLAGSYNPANGPYTIAPSSFTGANGATFTGWGSAPTSGANSAFAPGQQYSSAASVTLYAQWSTGSSSSSSSSGSSSSSSSSGSSSSGSSPSSSSLSSSSISGPHNESASSTQASLASTGTHTPLQLWIAISLALVGVLLVTSNRLRKLLGS